MLEDVRPQGRPCLMFSLDYGDIYEGERNVELCTGFCCVFNEEASRKFLRDWRHKVDATAESWDQLQVNQIYKTWSVPRRVLLASRRWRRRDASTARRPRRRSGPWSSSTTRTTSAA